jgi:hypothetical protein
MTRGERHQIPSADALIAAARARAAERSQPTARTVTITIPLPSRRAVKRAALWTLGIVLFICALPFLLWGLSMATWDIASLFYEPHTSAHLVLWFVLTAGTVYGTHIGLVVWTVWRDRRNGPLQAEIAAAAAMAERNPLSGLLRESAGHWHVVLAVVRLGIVAALIVGSLSAYHAHHRGDPTDPLTAWTPILFLVVASAFLFDWSWAIITAIPVAIGRALRSLLHLIAR